MTRALRFVLPALTLAASAILAEERPVLRYVPKHEELKYTFGGAAPRTTSSRARASSRGRRTATTAP